MEVCTQAYSSRGLRVHDRGMGAKQQAWSLRAHILNFKHKTERENWKWHEVFKLSKPFSCDIPGPQSHTSMTSPNKATNWGPCIQTFGAMGDILIQTNTTLIINKMREKSSKNPETGLGFSMCACTHRHTQKESKRYRIYLIKKVSLPLVYLVISGKPHWPQFWLLAWLDGWSK